MTKVVAHAPRAMSRWYKINTMSYSDGLDKLQSKILAIKVLEDKTRARVRKLISITEDIRDDHERLLGPQGEHWETLLTFCDEWIEFHAPVLQRFEKVRLMFGDTPRTLAKNSAPSTRERSLHEVLENYEVMRKNFEIIMFDLDETTILAKKYYSSLKEIEGVE